ncbi:alpha/beta-hydrolase [Panus rudis PR-1116 ss-1]|nr:alpha/beta-hydrolase [Panus rudis PR-1116 ss-1]
MFTTLGLLAATFAIGSVYGQVPAKNTPPHDYPGKPSGGFSPAWQNYFEVTQSLPNISFPLQRSFAGNIPVNRTGHPNNTLFFWAFEKENGSLTAGSGERSNEPWGIWLNGGPGSSSLAGLLLENGPIRIGADYGASANNFSWSNLADYVWIDQPVGTGFSTVQDGAFVPDEDQMGADFWGFVGNLVEVFPSLKTRPLFITGESYAGTYIPYITKTYFGLKNPPAKLAKIAIGDGTVAASEVFNEMPTLSIIETYPQLIGYDPDVYNYFKEQTHLCGYDLNLTYPPSGKYPTLKTVNAGIAWGAEFVQDKRLLTKNGLRSKFLSHLATVSSTEQEKSDTLKKRDEWIKEKRDLTGRANGTIDPWYGCFLYEEMVEYALNFSAPWNFTGGNIFNEVLNFDVYVIPDALAPEAPQDPSVFLNNDVVRAAIHAPTSKDWVESVRYPFGGPGGQDPSAPPMDFLDELATNASKANVSIILYSGNDDSLVAHRGTEVTIQNTTFGGSQGFSRRPSTAWTNDRGEFAGVVHQERNWTFVLFNSAGHLVPATQPENAFIFLREFVLGNNQTGFFDGSNSVVGGENSSLLANDVIPGQSGIFVGSGTTQSTYTYPSATIAAWQSFTQTALPTPGATGSADSTQNGEMGMSSGGLLWSAIAGVVGVSYMILTYL